MTRANVELHIEELVLHGFAPADRYTIGESVERELARLFSEQDPPSQLSLSAEIPQLEDGAFEVAYGSKLEVIGSQIAQALYERLGQ
jgi:hypothetical protein